MVDRTKLKDYAKKLMFDMSEEEYETLEDEFKIILKQISLLENIEGVNEVKPMTFPFLTDKTTLRKDEIEEPLTNEEVLMNAEHVYLEQVKVPKVVE